MRISDWSSDVCSSDLRQNVMPIKSGAKHMRTPKVRDETSVNEREGSRQAVKNNESAGRRIKEALAGREVSWLVREKGYGDKSEERRVGEEGCGKCSDGWWGCE